MESQSRICPTCGEDHLSTEKCKIIDLLLLPDIINEFKYKNRKIRELNKTIEALRKQLQEIYPL